MRTDRERQREGPRRAAEPVAIPGYRVGFEVSFDAARKRAVLGPGLLANGGQLVDVDEPVALHYATARTPPVRGRQHYVYLSPAGELVADRLRPVFTVGQWTHCHPDDESLVAVARYYLGLAGDVLWAGADFMGTTREVWVAALTWTGDTHYRCDGVADEQEINAALDYQAEAELGGAVRLTAGSFACDGAVAGYLISQIEGEGPRTVLVAPSLSGFRSPATQIRNLRHIDGDNDRVYGTFGGAIAVENAFGENAGDVFIDGDLRVSGTVHSASA